MTVEFTLIVENGSSFAKGVRVRPFESFELDPTEARRLKLLEDATSADSTSVGAVRIGELVPDFRLTDQNHQARSLSPSSRAK